MIGGKPTVQNNMNKPGKMIKTARKENNLTREQLAEKINITPLKWSA